MAAYIQVEFENISEEQSSVLIAQLNEIGFDGFDETEGSLKAFIEIHKYDEETLNELSSLEKTSFNKTIIEETNWNEIWESNFKPVIVEDFAVIRAEFHQPIEGAKHDILITPKMSFGTGHHATTYMMIQEMRKLDFTGKTVLDFGTGTGVLAILAEKTGAKRTVAIDNDDWSISNASENILRNHCSGIELRKEDKLGMTDQFDVILANINKNVIIDNFAGFVKQLKTGGVLILSGFLPDDEHDIFRKKDEYSLQIVQTNVRANWLCIRLTH